MDSSGVATRLREWLSVKNVIKITIRYSVLQVTVSQVFNDNNALVNFSVISPNIFLAFARRVYRGKDSVGGGGGEHVFSRLLEILGMFDSILLRFFSD